MPDSASLSRCVTGFKVKISERGYFPEIDDESLALVLVRSQEIPRYVEDGVLDAGICGHDWVVGTDANVIEVRAAQGGSSQ